MSDGFLGRWSKRKLAKDEAEPQAEPLPSPQPSPHPAPVAGAGRGEGAPTLDTATPLPPPTLADTDLLTPSSDFTRFAARDVAPEVRNAAMKKLFADPHFNIMDGLDTYIDDYSQPDPMPASMLRQLASAKFLKLFDEEEKEEGAREVADDPTTQTVAQSRPEPEAVPEPPDDANPDLRLQPDDAAPGEDPGRGTS